jgi:hypothetical protein
MFPENKQKKIGYFKKMYARKKRFFNSKVSMIRFPYFETFPNDDYFYFRICFWSQHGASIKNLHFQEKTKIVMANLAEVTFFLGAPLRRKNFRHHLFSHPTPPGGENFLMLQFQDSKNALYPTWWCRVSKKMPKIFSWKFTPYSIFVGLDNV